MSIGAVSERQADPLAWLSELFGRILGNVESFIQGKREVARLALVGLLCEGHLLIEDVPGVGKTSLAKAIALSIEGTIQRIQFTPDLLPTDVTGAMVFNSQTSSFEFHPGGVFANVVVADEINRASPKTQSALLEVMEEQQVTVDSTPYPVPRPFIVVATQNPIEHDGTYRLPEAQVDRFIMKIAMGYPDHEAEKVVLAQRVRGETAEDLEPVVSIEDVQQMILYTRRVHMSERLTDYIVSLTSATRNLPELRLGVSPRGTLALGITARAVAASNGRRFVTADDVKSVIHPVLGHRMLLAPEAQLRGVTATTVLNRLVAEIGVPQDRDG